MVDLRTDTCAVCGDAVTFDIDSFDDDEDDTWIPICNCCLSIICEKHTAEVSCPHEPAAHDG